VRDESDHPFGLCASDPRTCQRCRIGERRFRKLRRFVTRNFSLAVYDTLFGYDAEFKAQP
jgi:hypothetical protein